LAGKKDCFRRNGHECQGREGGSAWGQAQGKSLSPKGVQSTKKKKGMGDELKKKLSSTRKEEKRREGGQHDRK